MYNVHTYCYSVVLLTILYYLLTTKHLQKKGSIFFREFWPLFLGIMSLKELGLFSKIMLTSKYILFEFDG